MFCRSKRSASFFILGAFLILVTPPARAETNDLQAAIDQIANEAIQSGRTAALGIAIDRGGILLIEKGYGYADIEKKTDATPETIYRIGSVTKQFTAVAILQLQVAGKFQLEDAITSVLTDYPAPPKPVTVEHLLQHTSGIPDFTRDPSHRPNAFKDMSHAEMFARFDALPLDFNPGSRSSYSNSGYYLLGMIIERVSGETYADYMATHVLAPIGLEQTRYEAPDGSGRAQGYRPDGGNLVVADSISMTQPFAAGALVSTTGDLVKWQRALVDRRTNPPDAFVKMTTDVMRTRDGAYGFGVRVSTVDGRRVIHHGGGIEGFGSYLAYYPDTDTTIVLLANTEGFNMRELLERVEAVLFQVSEEE